MDMFSEAMNWLKTQSSGGAYANPRQMAMSLGLDASATTKLYKTLKGAVPLSDTFLFWLEKLGVRLVYPGDVSGEIASIQISDPLAKRVDTVSKTLREQGVAELEILRAVRSMLDSEIAKAQSSYGTREPGATFGKAAEDTATYAAEKKE